MNSDQHGMGHRGTAVAAWFVPFAAGIGTTVAMLSGISLPLLSPAGEGPAGSPGNALLYDNPLWGMLVAAVQTASGWAGISVEAVTAGTWLAAVLTSLAAGGIGLIVHRAVAGSAKPAWARVAGSWAAGILFVIGARTLGHVSDGSDASLHAALTVLFLWLLVRWTEERSDMTFVVLALVAGWLSVLYPPARVLAPVLALTTLLIRPRLFLHASAFAGALALGLAAWAFSPFDDPFALPIAICLWLFASAFLWNLRFRNTVLLAAAAFLVGLSVHGVTLAAGGWPMVSGQMADIMHGRIFPADTACNLSVFLSEQHRWYSVFDAWRVLMAKQWPFFPFLAAFSVVGLVAAVLRPGRRRLSVLWLVMALLFGPVMFAMIMMSEPSLQAAVAEGMAMADVLYAILAGMGAAWILSWLPLRKRSERSAAGATIRAS